MTAKLRRASEIGAIVIIGALVPGPLHAQPAGATAQPGDWVYTVRPRDTLWALGRTHLIHPADWTRLQRLNRLSSDRLVPGMRLRIPFDLMRLRPAPARVLETRGSAHVLRASGQRAPLAIDRLLYAGDGGAPVPPVALLAPPELGAPAPPLRRLPFRLTIPPVAGAAGYHWDVGAGGAFQSLAVDTTSTLPTVQLPDVPDGPYAFRVRAIDGQGLEGFDANGQFQIDARPEAPFLMAPAPGAVVRMERPPLTWTQPTDAAGFRVQISRDDSSGLVLVDGPAMPGRAFVPDTALDPGTYVWRVATRLADGEEGAFGDAQTFTVRRPPESPTAEPPALAVGSLALRWPASSGAGIRYQAQLARDGGFAALESEHTVSEPQLTLPRPTPGTYYLRVRAIDADGFEGAFGTTQAFTVPSAEIAEPQARRRWWLWLLPPVAVAGLAILLF